MTIHLAEGPTGGGVRRSLARWNLELHRAGPGIRYVFSVLCVAVALGAALACQYYGFRDMELPLFDLAIVVSTWYAGTGPAVLAVVLSAAFYNYFFTEPLYSFDVSNEDLPRFLLFMASAAIAAWFVAVRRRIESDLRDARDNLRVELEQRKRREDEIRKLNNELAKRASDLETSNNELESLCLFRLPRPSRAASPCGRVFGAASETGVQLARREESSVHANDSRSVKKNG